MTNWKDSHNWKTQAQQKYGESLEQHIRYVQEAGKLVGVEDAQRAEHDLSKYTDAEFPHYALFFHGPPIEFQNQLESVYRANNFAVAWLHHIHHNPHHWQHWMFPDKFYPSGSTVQGGLVEMPEIYVREMVADWMGASMAYTGQWNMLEWLQKNIPKIQLHPKSMECLLDILENIGYESAFDPLANEWRFWATPPNGSLAPSKAKAITYST